MDEQRAWCNYIADWEVRNNSDRLSSDFATLRDLLHMILMLAAAPLIYFDIISFYILSFNIMWYQMYLDTQQEAFDHLVAVPSDISCSGNWITTNVPDV